MLSLAKNTIERVAEFDYLGISLEDKNSWKAQLNKSSLTLGQKAGVIQKFANNKTVRPVSPAITIWKAQAISAATYGAELWGHCDTGPLTIIENKFLRSFLKLPQSTPWSNYGWAWTLRPFRGGLGYGRFCTG